MKFVIEVSLENFPRADTSGGWLQRRITKARPL
jgi:hypothetical protein